MKVVVDEGKCCGYGVCVDAAPEIFNLTNDEGPVLLKIDEVPTELQDSARAAVNTCPTQAIVLEE